MALSLSQTAIYSGKLTDLALTNLLITTINAHSYNVAQYDAEFAEVLQKSDILLPDGISVVLAAKFLASNSKRSSESKLKKIAGEDLFYYEMHRLQKIDHGQQKREKKKAFFLGSSEDVLVKIKERANKEFPNLEIHTWSPPYKPEFSEEDNEIMINAINAVSPDVLFIGMTAPKQEKWAYKIINSGKLIIENCHVCCIGAVFDFYAGTVKRSPKWIINFGLEWLYRLFKEPRRMWKRYLVGNMLFIWGIIRE